MTEKRLILARYSVYALALGFLAWLLVWGFATTHPESGLSPGYALPVGLIVLLVTAVFLALRASRPSE